MFAAPTLLVLASLTAAPVDLHSAPITVDVIEVNHVYTPDGEHRIDQVIFWEWNQRDSRYDIVAWRYLRLAGRPQLDHRRRVWICRWLVGSRLYEVQARSTRETWTDYDPEVTTRRQLEPHLRRGFH